MFTRAFFVRHLQRETKRLSEYYRDDRMKALAHWAVGQLDWSQKPNAEPSLRDEEIARIVDIGGPGDGKIDSSWPDDTNKTLWIVQVKGSEILLDQDIEDIDEDEDIEMSRFGDEAIIELGHALRKAPEST